MFVLNSDIKIKVFSYLVNLNPIGTLFMLILLRVVRGSTDES